MSNKQIRAINFLASHEHQSVKFFIYGNEHALCYRSKHHCVKNKDLKIMEKVFLDLESVDFESLLNQSLMSNSLFNEEKIIYIAFKKNRLNKELLNKFQLIMEYVTKNTIVVDIPNLTKKTIEKELINHKDGNAIFIDCFMPFESEVRKFLESNLPNYLKKTEYIEHLIEMYEGNFSLFLNDFEILNLLKIDNADIAMQVFSKNVNKGNSKLIEYICKKDAKLALSVIQSMKTNDRNSVPLLVWILIRDINAIKYLKEGKSIKSLRIRENQVQWYKKISSRLTLKTIEKLVNELDLVDKRFRGVLNGDPWNGIKSIVLSLSA